MITAQHACPAGIEGIGASSLPYQPLPNPARNSSIVPALPMMPFGIDQLTIAQLGICPCTTCPDCYMEDNGSCRNEDLCTAWDTYCYHY